MTRYLIAGSGIATFSGAEAIRRTDAGARITMLSSEGNHRRQAAGRR